jgi:transposase-like protein
VVFVGSCLLIISASPPLARCFRMPGLWQRSGVGDGPGACPLLTVCTPDVNSTALVPSDFSACSGSRVTRRLGLGYTNKLRRAMVRPDRDRLSGEVEVDESFLGGRDSDIDGRETDRSLIVIAAEIRGHGIGRIRMAAVEDAAADSLIPFIQHTVTEGAIIRTDGWSGYVPLSRHGYIHRPRSVRAARRPAHELMPRVHRVSALLKRWWLGTYHGAIADWHLDYYLDEFTFRFNRRTSRARGLLFYRLLQQAVGADPVPYAQIRGGKDHYL